MGDRGNIVFKYTDGNKIYFYSHWGGSDLKETLRQALIRGKERWEDEIKTNVGTDSRSDNILKQCGVI